MLLELAAYLAGAHAQCCEIKFFAHKKTRPRGGPGFSARFSGIYYAPASCGSNRREGSQYISGKRGQSNFHLGEAAPAARLRGHDKMDP
jgi:hypothetical protein